MTDLRKAAQQALEALKLNCGSQTQSPATAAITALRAALAEPDVPEGFVLVPVEPTEEMAYAGARSIIEGREKRPGVSWAEEAQMAYAAMLASAPKGGA